MNKQKPEQSLGLCSSVFAWRMPVFVVSIPPGDPHPSVVSRAVSWTQEEDDRTESEDVRQRSGVWPLKLEVTCQVTDSCWGWRAFGYISHPAGTHRALLLARKWDRNKCPITSEAPCPKVLNTLPVNPPPRPPRRLAASKPLSIPSSLAFHPLMFFKWAFQLHLFLAIQFYKAIIPGVMWRLNISGQTLCENN